MSTAPFVAAPGIYLLNHSVGLPPLNARAAHDQGFMVPWESGGEDVWPRWLEAIDGFRDELAHLFNPSALFTLTVPANSLQANSKMSLLILMFIKPKALLKSTRSMVRQSGRLNQSLRMCALIWRLVVRLSLSGHLPWLMQ